MKKSLKVIASAAVAFSMFASVAMADDAATTTTTSTSATTTAAVKTSADFKDLANASDAVKAQVDAMLKAGVFEGVSADSFGIDQNMTRAQAAKVLTLIYNINVDKTVMTSSFSDVKGDDAANGWAIPYIEAAKKAGLIDGVTDTTFAPGDNVTLGQFAKLLVAGLGNKVDVTGTPWYADAVKQAVALKLLPDGTDGSKLATRADLVGGAYNGQAAYVTKNAPAQVGISDAKQTGAKVITVTFNGPVQDTDKATFTVKRSGNAVTATPSFSDDKKTATLTFANNLTAGTYNVAVAGYTNIDSKMVSKDVTTESETIKKIDFVSANDTIPEASKVKIAFKATNQFGETATLSASNFRIIVNGSNGNSYNTVSGQQAFTIDTTGSGTASGKNGVVSATVIYDSTGVQANAVYKIGNKQLVSKIELSDLMDANGNKLDYIKTGGNTAYMTVKAFDQYGIQVTDKATLNGNGGVTIVSSDSDLVTGDGAGGLAFVNDINNDGVDDLQLYSKGSTEKTVNVNFFANGSGSSVTKAIKLAAVSAPATLEAVDFTTTFADGDTAKVVPFVAKDSTGKQLSAQDLADNQSNFTIYSIGGALTIDSTNPIIQTGSDKGKINITSVSGTGSNQVVVQLKNNPNVKVTINVNVQSKRVPDSVVWDSTVASKIQYGNSSKFKIKVVDQYGDEYKTDTVLRNDLYGVALTLTNNTGDTDATIEKTAAPGVTELTYGQTKLYKVSNFNKVEFLLKGATVNADANYTVSAKIVKLKTAPLTEGVITTAALDAVKDAYGNELSKNVLFSSGSALNSGLTYSVTLDSSGDNNSVFAYANYDSTTAATYQAATPKYVGKLLNLNTKDSGGNSVVTNSALSNVSSDSDNVVVFQSGGAWYVQGKGDGSANITAVYTKSDGTMATSQFVVTSKKVNPVLKDVSVGNTAKTISYASLNGLYAYDGSLSGDIKTHDQYNTEYVINATGANTLSKVNSLLNVSYYISNVTYKAGTADAAKDQVTIDSTGKITTTGANDTITSFTINVLTPSGKVASTDVSVTH